MIKKSKYNLYIYICIQNFPGSGKYNLVTLGSQDLEQSAGYSEKVYNFILYNVFKYAVRYQVLKRKISYVIMLYGVLN